MTGKEHAKLLGLFFWVYVGIQLLGLIVGIGAMVLMSGVMMAEFSNMPQSANQPDPAVFFGMMSGVMIFVFIIAMIMLIPIFLAGYGLRKEKSWAKIAAIISCCLAVLSVPLGTGLAIYGFWFIFSDEGKAYFDHAPQASAAPPPPQSWR